MINRRRDEVRQTNVMIAKEQFAKIWRSKELTSAAALDLIRMFGHCLNTRDLKAMREWAEMELICQAEEIEVARGNN